MKHRADLPRVADGGVQTGGKHRKGRRLGTPSKCCPGAGSMAHVRGCVNHPERPYFVRGRR